MNIERELVNLLTKLIPPPSRPITCPHFDATSAKILSGTIVQKFTTFEGKFFVHTSRSMLSSGPSMRRMVFSGNSSAILDIIFCHVSMGSDRVEYAPRKIKSVFFDCSLDLQSVSMLVFFCIVLSFSASLSLS